LGALLHFLPRERREGSFILQEKERGGQTGVQKKRGCARFWSVLQRGGKAKSDYCSKRKGKKGGGVRDGKVGFNAIPLKRGGFSKKREEKGGCSKREGITREKETRATYKSTPRKKKKKGRNDR